MSTLMNLLASLSHDCGGVLLRQVGAIGTLQLAATCKALHASMLSCNKTWEYFTRQELDGEVCLALGSFGSPILAYNTQQTTLL